MNQSEEKCRSSQSCLGEAYSARRVGARTQVPWHDRCCRETLGRRKKPSGRTAWREKLISRARAYSMLSPCAQRRKK